jgi:hypothetical protein
VDSPGTKRLIAEVEQTTGFKVVIDTIDDITEHAQMVSARPELPVHTIRVSKAKLATAGAVDVDDPAPDVDCAADSVLKRHVRTNKLAEARAARGIAHAMCVRPLDRFNSTLRGDYSPSC